MPDVLDKNRIEILRSSIATEQVKACKDTIRERESCLDYELGDQHIDFHFRNIVLSGTKANSTTKNETTKGELEFKIKPKVVQVGNKFTIPVEEDILIKAAIKFDTEEDTIFTNQIDTRFRVRAIGLKAGFNAGRDLSELVGSAKGLSNILLSVSFSDNPVHDGLAWESELAYSSYRYTREKTFIFINESNPLIKDTLNTSLSLALFYADILAQSRYHFNDYFGIGFGGGFAALIAGTGSYDVTLNNGLETETVTQDINNGLLFLNKQYDEIVFPSGISHPSSVQNNPGSYLATIFFAEIGVGKVNKGPMVGFRYGSRFQNGLFDVSFARQNFMQFFFQWKI